MGWVYVWATRHALELSVGHPSSETPSAFWEEADETGGQKQEAGWLRDYKADVGNLVEFRAGRHVKDHRQGGSTESCPCRAPGCRGGEWDHCERGTASIEAGHDIDRAGVWGLVWGFVVERQKIESAVDIHEGQPVRLADNVWSVRRHAGDSDERWIEEDAVVCAGPDPRLPVPPL